MNNLSAKEILSAYRPDGSDAQDKYFEKALKQCRHDPELRAWFSEQVNFDASVASKLREICGPEDGKQAILTFAHLEKKQSEKPRWRRMIPFLVVGVAAMLLLTLSLFNSPSSAPSKHFDSDSFSVAGLVGQVMPLDHQSKNRVEVLQWLEDHDAPVPPELPEVFELANTEGCRIFTDGEGGQVSLFCFEMNGELVHVLTFDERTRQLLDQPRGVWWSEGDLNIVAFEKDRDLFAIATRLPVEMLGKYM